MRSKLASLQALRGIACLLVVLYHVGGWEVLIWPRIKLLYPIRWFGYAGVDLFFVLSGFIISWSHLEQLGQPARLWKYLLRRFWRIFPPFWAAMLAAGALLWFVQGVDPLSADFAITWQSWLLAPGMVNHLLPVSWSLTYELMFYCVFAILFLLPRGSIVYLLGIWAMCVLVLGGLFTAAEPWSALLTSPYVLEFLGGVLVAVLVRRGWQLPGRPTLLLALGWCGGLLVLNAGPGPDDLAARSGQRVLTFAFPALLLVWVCAQRDTPTRWLPVWLQKLGDASYSIYLMHVPSAGVIFYLTFGMSHRFVPHLGWLILMMAAGIGGGWLFYRLIERPLLNLATRKPMAPPIVVGPISVLHEPQSLVLPNERPLRSSPSSCSGS